MTKKYISDMIPVTVAGIPAYADVTYYEKIPGTYSDRADTAEEFFGTVELEYDLYDRKGYRAKWLEKKLDDPETESEVYEQIKNYMEER